MPIAYRVIFSDTREGVAAQAEGGHGGDNWTIIGGFDDGIHRFDNLSSLRNAGFQGEFGRLLVNEEGYVALAFRYYEL